MAQNETKKNTEHVADELLRDQLRAYQAKHIKSNAEIARRIGYSPAVISLYLASDPKTGMFLPNKYSGDILKLERKIADFIRNESRRRASGVETTNCEVAEEINTALEYIRKTNDIGVILAESGNGKTRGIEHYFQENPLTIIVSVRQWARDVSSVESALLDAVGKTSWDGQSKRATWMVSKLRGSERLIIVDDAHKLTRPALQYMIDFHEETGCPLGLVGTFALLDLMEDDPQRFSRAGLRFEIKPQNGRKLIEHLVKTFVPDAGDETDHVIALCELVAAEHGHYRSVHKQLKLASEIKDSKPKVSWVDAFRAAHTMLIRKYALTD